MYIPAGDYTRLTNYIDGIDGAAPVITFVTKP
jgi:hypothetical protein